MQHTWTGLLLAVLTATSVAAQVPVEGRVVDAATGEPLAAATLQVEGTYVGTITNAEGRFALAVPELPATLVVRFIGYETAAVPLDRPPAAPLTIRLAPAAVAMDEIVVTGDNPAIAIMRRVIERKQQWRADLDRYRADAYNRFTISNDTGIVSIIESLTEVYWTRDGGLREVMLARRSTANLELDDVLPAAEFVLNLYDDDIEIAGHRLMGVTHPDALGAYTFTLEGTRTLDEQVVYDIGVRPRNRFVSGFEGRVAVLGEAWALLEAELRPGRAFYFPRPIERFETTYRQQFSNFGGEAWLPVDFRSEAEIDIAFGFLLSLPTIRLDQVSRLTDYAFDFAIPDSLYDSDDRVVAGPVAVDADTDAADDGERGVTMRVGAGAAPSESAPPDSVAQAAATAAAEAAADSLLDRSGVAVPLSDLERMAYVSIDSTNTLEQAFAPSGTLARFLEDDEDDPSGGDGGRSGPLARLGIEATPNAWFNRVEAAHLGLGLSRRFGPVTLSVRGGYQTGRDVWTGGAGVGARLGRRTDAGIEVFDGTAPAYASALFNRTFNSAAVLLGAPDYYDYADQRGGAVRLGHRVRGLGVPLRLDLEGRLTEYASVDETTSYDLVGRAVPQRLNPAVDDGWLRTATLRVELGDDLDTGGFTGGTGLILTAEAGALEAATVAGRPPSVQPRDAAFTRWQAVAQMRVVPYLRRRLFAPTLDIRLVGSASGGTLPGQRLFALDGSLGGADVALTPFGGLRTRTGRPYLGDRSAAVFWEHNLRALPFELVGLYGAARRGYSVILHGGHGRTWLDTDPLADPFSSFFLPTVRALALVPDGWHHEVGVSFSGLLGVLRLDATWRLDAPGFTLGLSTARIF